MNLLERITVEPGKFGGRPCIRGMRIRVADILAMLVDDVSQEQILKDFPYLEPDDIKAALAYAARQADHADMATQARRADLAAFDRVMSRVPDVPPIPGDELPEGYQRSG